MFSRVHFQEGVSAIAIAAFVIISCVYLYYLWRAGRMSRDQVTYMARRPLDDDTPNDNARS